MWIQRMPGRREDYGRGKSAVSDLSDFGAPQFTHRADSGSCGVSVRGGRYGLRTGNRRIGCPTSTWSGKGSELDWHQREPLTRTANLYAVLPGASRLWTPAVIEPIGNTDLPCDHAD